MGLTTAQTIQEITKNHLEKENGLLLGQCVTAVGWIGGTVPDCNGIMEIPMTDVAGSAFAVGCALVGRRPIFVMRYQGFLWYNCSSLINYAGRSKQVWGVPCPVFIRCIGMEGNGVGHTASSCLHSIMMHVPGIPVAAPMTPLEYRAVWEHFRTHDDPIFVSEHRRSFVLTDEMSDQRSENSKITLVAISAGRIPHDLFHVMWLKPFAASPELLASLSKTKLGVIIDSDFEIAGAAQSFAYELMLRTGAKIHALGLEDRVCGVAPAVENITPSAEKIAAKVSQLLRA